MHMQHSMHGAVNLVTQRDANPTVPVFCWLLLCRALRSSPTTQSLPLCSCTKSDGFGKGILALQGYPACTQSGRGGGGGVNTGFACAQHELSLQTQVMLWMVFGHSLSFKCMMAFVTASQ
jgi:hypothetical protein